MVCTFSSAEFSIAAAQALQGQHLLDLHWHCIHQPVLICYCADIRNYSLYADLLH